MNQGYIAVHRKMLDNPIVCKDTDHMAVWMYLLLNATHTNYDVFFKNERLTLSPGQLLTGRKSISTQLKVSESKVQRILKLFETEQQIEQQTSNQNRLITIVRWNDYQRNERQSEQQVNNKRTTDEQQVNTNNNVNKVNNEITTTHTDGEVFKRVVSKFQNNGFGLITPDTSSRLISLSETYTDDWLEDALDIAIDNNKRSLSYVEAILRRWFTEGKDDNTSRNLIKSTNSWKVDAT